jgi:LacI family transcriptional regulator
LRNLLPSEISIMGRRMALQAGKARMRKNGELRRATLSDVARAARVSVMTVSNFVRGKNVRIQARNRVQEAIALLNYRPNLSARGLRLSAVHSVGLLIADTNNAFLNDPFTSRIASGLSNYLSTLGYTLDVQGVLPERFNEAKILNKLGNDALCAVLCGPKKLRKAQIAQLQRLNQPVVVLQEDGPPSGINLATVSQDDLAGGRLIGRHLLSRTPRSLLFVRPSLDWWAVEQREKGLRSELARSRRQIKVTTLIAPSEGFEDVLSTVRDYLGSNTPDAIVAATDSMAAAALKACEQAGLRVPRDLVLSGFNGFDVSLSTTPTLTTIVSPAYEMGRYAGELLLARLGSGSFPKSNSKFPVSLREGGSTGNPKQPEFESVRPPGVLTNAS